MTIINKTDQFTDHLNLPSRLITALHYDNIYTIEQLVALSVIKIGRIPNVGKKSVNELKEELAKNNLFLANDQPTREFLLCTNCTSRTFNVYQGFILSCIHCSADYKIDLAWERINQR